MRASLSTEFDDPFFTYGRALLCRPAWDKVCHGDFYLDARSYADHARTSVVVCISSVFQGLSATSGKKTKIIVEEPDWTMKPIIFLINIADSGTGKTQSYDKLLREPMEAVQFKEKARILVVDMTFIGIGLYATKWWTCCCSDEICSFLEKAYTGKQDELKGFANIAYDGQRYTKHMASKTIDIKNTMLSIAGTTQPETYIQFQTKLAKMKDGSRENDHLYRLTDEASAYIIGLANNEVDAANESVILLQEYVRKLDTGDLSTEDIKETFYFIVVPDYL